jgi:hypothetical protein
VQVVSYRGQRDVHDRHVDADDEQAQAADREHEHAASQAGVAEFDLAHPCSMPLVICWPATNYLRSRRARGQEG